MNSRPGMNGYTPSVEQLELRNMAKNFGDVMEKILVDHYGSKAQYFLTIYRPVGNERCQGATATNSTAGQVDLILAAILGQLRALEGKTATGGVGGIFDLLDPEGGEPS